MDAEYVANIINANVIQPEFAKPLRQPGAPRTFSEGWCRDAGHLELPMGQLWFLRSEPVECGANLGRGRESCHFLLHAGEHLRHLTAGTERHGLVRPSYNGEW